MNKIKLDYYLNSNCEKVLRYILQLDHVCPPVVT